jgi:23S rRNA (pseudouridine1915-N3)-methyltransferase
MKFSELNETQWVELAPYLDTCILPISGVDGTETPTEMVNKLSTLQKLIDEIEKDFRGRIVIFPAFHYSNEGYAAQLINLISNIKNNHFAKVVCISSELESEKLVEFGADIVFSIKSTELEKLEIKKTLPLLWE